MVQRFLRTAIALTSTACLFGACTTEPEPARVTIAEGCLINTNCNAPLVCAFRRCHEECQDSRDCPTGQRCISSDRPFHVCQLPIETKCTYNTQCPETQKCGVDGQCRDECTSDRDCVSGQMCASGTCAEPAELTGGKLPTADAGNAENPGGGLPCVYDSECREPLICRDGLCGYECLEHGDCPRGEQCDGHRCRVPACGAAGTPLGLDAGGPCQYTSQCPAPLVCRDGICSCECLANADCAPGNVCRSSRCVGSADAGSRN
jgi:hypothetical protein